MEDKKLARRVPIEIGAEGFRTIGHNLVDQIADFLDSLPQRPVTRYTTPAKLQQLLGDRPIPEQGSDPAKILAEVSEMLFEHSLFNGHPRFWGYITSSAAPVGALGDLLAAVVNPNVGAWDLSPIATEIESQTVRWIAELIGYPPDCGGVLTSGGNVANFVGFLAGRLDKAGWTRLAGIFVPRVCMAGTAANYVSMSRRRPTPGFRKPPICSVLEPGPFAGFLWILRGAWI